MIVTKLPESPLSPTQREIMEIVWERGEVAAIEVREVLSKRRAVARETVRTIIRRMEEKGWLKHRVIGRTHFYSAALPEAASLGQQVVQLVDDVCGGSPERLVTALLDYRGLTEGEAARIESMLKEARKNRGRRR